MAKAEKIIKKQIIEEASKNPQKFYPVKTLEKLKLTRQTCTKCNVKFWASVKRDVCGEPECMGGYSFIGKTPSKNPMSFTQVYKEFSKMLQKEGYTPIQRFPVVARWRDDLDFNIASIVGFQPYVVSGQVKPQANPLTIPQPCLRFGDIDNIGYTGRHHTGFTMIGQHTFQSPENYDQDSYFKVWFNWYLNGLKIPIEELTVHEDAWAGGGNCGASLEVFSRGLEIGNQVYMTYDMNDATTLDELKELDIKVLDMGMGQERCCWFSQGSKNTYEATMPEVCKYLFKTTSLKPNWKVYDKFLPFSGSLNIDEVEDIEVAWQELADKIKVDVNELKEQIEPLAGLYSIADHTRTLLYALADGALPSNVKGGYNLRLILRRALSFIEKYNWDVDLYEVMLLHAKELNDLYPELEVELTHHTGDNIPTLKKLLDMEKVKFSNHKEKIKNTVASIVKKGKELDNNELIKLYISEGITPEDIKGAYLEQGKKIEIPSNFYTLVTEYFEEQKEKENTKKSNSLKDQIKDLPETVFEFYKDTYKESGDFKILKEFEFEKKKYIVLDKTLFYPTMGGQACDLGKIGEKQVIDVVKVGNVILHEVK